MYSPAYTRIRLLDCLLRKATQEFIGVLLTPDKAPLSASHWETSYTFSSVTRTACTVGTFFCRYVLAMLISSLLTLKATGWLFSLIAALALRGATDPAEAAWVGGFVIITGCIIIAAARVRSARRDCLPLPRRVPLPIPSIPKPRAANRRVGGEGRIASSLLRLGLRVLLLFGEECLVLLRLLTVVVDGVCHIVGR